MAFVIIKFNKEIFHHIIIVFNFSFFKFGNYEYSKFQKKILK